jgi:hypothetical protein
MNTLKNLVHAAIHPDREGGYVAICDEVAVVVRAATLEATVVQLRDEVLRHLNDGILAEVSLVSRPRLRILLDIELAREAIEPITSAS